MEEHTTCNEEPPTDNTEAMQITPAQEDTQKKDTIPKKQVTSNYKHMNKNFYQMKRTPPSQPQRTLLPTPTMPQYRQERRSPYQRPQQPHTTLSHKISHPTLTQSIPLMSIPAFTYAELRHLQQQLGLPRR